MFENSQLTLGASDVAAKSYTDGTAALYLDNRAVPSIYTLTGTNLTNMTMTNTTKQIIQVKVAVFETKRSEKTNEITSAKFVTAMWVELKPHVNLELAVAKQLDNFDPETTIIREIYRITL